MKPSIPVATFVNPTRGGRAWRAVCRASRLRPSVDLIGTFETEKYFRVQGAGRDPHAVIIWIDKVSEEPVASCDCESHRIPMAPEPCFHIAATLIHEGASEEL